MVPANMLFMVASQGTTSRNVLFSPSEAARTRDRLEAAAPANRVVIPYLE